MSEQTRTDDDVVEFLDDKFWDSKTNPSNTIVSLDAHTNDKSDSQFDTIQLDDLGRIADALGDVGFFDAAAQFEILVHQFTEHDDFVARRTVGGLTNLQLKLTVAYEYCECQMADNIEEPREQARAIQSWTAFVDASVDGKLDADLKQNGVTNMIRVGTREQVTDPFDLGDKDRILFLDEDDNRIQTLEGIRAFEPQR